MTEIHPAAAAAGTGPIAAPAWRQLGIEVGEADSLISAGAELLERLADDPVPAARWYRASAPALVLGRGQGPIVHLGDPGLSVVTRLSGGGAVLMDADLLSLDLLVPAGHPLLAGDLSDAFIEVGQVWVAALSDLGVADLAVHHGPSPATRRGSARQRLLAAVCYATLGRGEVTAGGRKLVGLAQRRRRAGALIQCGLLRRWRPDALLAVLGEPAPDEDIAQRAVGLDDLLRPAPSDEAVIAAVAARLENPDG